MAHLPDGLILASAAPEVPLNGDVHHPYRQASDFLWLTGVEAPGYALLLDPRRGEEILFRAEAHRSPCHLARPHPEPPEARAEFGVAKDGAPRRSPPTVLRKRLRGRAVVHADRRSLSLVRRRRRRRVHPRVLSRKRSPICGS
jgi:Xaa-Pro aminopeptidase